MKRIFRETTLSVLSVLRLCIYTLAIVVPLLICAFFVDVGIDNYKSVCPITGERVSEGVMINNVLEYMIQRRQEDDIWVSDANDGGSYQRIKYVSVAEFRKENPDCCSVGSTEVKIDGRKPVQTSGLGRNFGNWITGYYGDDVVLKYKVFYTDTAGKKAFKQVYESWTVDFCGKADD